ncbi:MAG: hypothetical protein L0Y32_06145 [Nevskiales bacterium]|nr:hypothetical protein [Nevskiales bacterium]
MPWLSSPPNIQFVSDGGCHFGNPHAEAVAALSGTAVMPLSHLGLIQVSGPEAEAFLQGQLSNDVRELNTGRVQLSSYNSPKGRLLAVLNLSRDTENIFMEIHRSVLDSTLQRLRMFVLRSKVVLSEVSGERVVIGLAGPEAEKSLASLGLPVPAGMLDAVWSNDICVIRRHSHRSTRQRFSLHVPVGLAAGLWTRLAARAKPAGTQAWKLLDLLAGLPTIYPETRDHFVPQMCNLDTLGGISFNKGCYTGQEIVARVHYRGAVKRRMTPIRLSQDPPRPGSAVSEGEVVDAVPHPEGGSLALVVGVPET